MLIILESGLEVPFVDLYLGVEKLLLLGLWFQKTKGQGNGEKGRRREGTGREGKGVEEKEVLSEK